MVSTRTLAQFDPEIATLIRHETERQEYGLEMIPSENFVSESVLEANGSVLTNKYAEGLPRKRYYGGCECVDGVEEIAIARAKQLFGAEFVNAQPHSGAQANHAVFEAFLAPGDTIMGMRLDQGGHLTHGSPYNVSGKRYKVVAYGVREDTHLIDPDQVRDVALKNKPKLIICGASAYSRVIDFKFFSEVAKEVGALLLADVAHYAGLIAGGVYPSPVPFADIVSTTTHKTLRGPRSGLLMGKEIHATPINKAVFPGLQGGPHMHTIAAKAVAFKEALEPSFKDYAKQTVLNAQALANELMAKGLKIVSGGTDSHVMLVDVRPYKLTGQEAEAVLAKIEVTCNKNTIPFDPEKPMVASGVRLGTPALTTRGMKEADMVLIARGIASALEHKSDDAKLSSIREDMRGIASRFPLYKHRLVG
jgi:glycine hydroxymethyltransferase